MNEGFHFVYAPALSASVNHTVAIRTNDGDVLHRLIALLVFSHWHYMVALDEIFADFTVGLEEVKSAYHALAAVVFFSCFNELWMTLEVRALFQFSLTFREQLLLC